MLVADGVAMWLAWVGGCGRWLLTCPAGVSSPVARIDERGGGRGRREFVGAWAAAAGGGKVRWGGSLAGCCRLRPGGGGRGRLRLVVGRFVGVVRSLVMVGCGRRRSPRFGRGVGSFLAGGEEW